ncbi:hypothetical protein [Thioclava kandeliae]|uniref:Uncharacterized protein n=1 Tax=Thioclava kandeliae TaxID=3070818 RepID=A0ABV1SM76_9RHOB
MKNSSYSSILVSTQLEGSSGYLNTIRAMSVLDRYEFDQLISDEIIEIMRRPDFNEEVLLRLITEISGDKVSSTGLNSLFHNLRAAIQSDNMEEYEKISNEVAEKILKENFYENLDDSKEEEALYSSSETSALNFIQYSQNS